MSPLTYPEPPSEGTLHCAGRSSVNGTHHEAVEAVVDSFDDQVGEDERMGARVHAWHVPSAGVGVRIYQCLAMCSIAYWA